MGSLYQKGSRFRNPHLRLSVAGMWQKSRYAGGLAGVRPGTAVARYRWFCAMSPGESRRTIRPHPYFVIVSFTASTSWLSVNGFGRKSNCWPSGRLFSKASSA